MDDAAVFISSFHRPNLRLSAAPKVGETAQLLDFLKSHRGECGIVYCGSRAKTERVAVKLGEKGYPALPFHAGLDPTLKRESLMRFRSGEPLVVVATIAFGMGIDRPDVRFVVHLDMPDSPEAYYQQIGRAGRDGDPSDTLLLFGGQDVAQARHWLAQSAAPDERKRVMRTKLEEMIALTEAVTCRTRSLLTCFGETLEAACGHCDNCEAPPITTDATTEAQMVLSAVYRTGQSFGAVHIVAVLRGERTETVSRRGPRPTAHLRRRRRAFAGLLAGADTAVDRYACAGCGHQRPWRPVSGAGGGAADPARRAAGGAAAGSAAGRPGGTAGSWAGAADCHTMRWAAAGSGIRSMDGTAEQRKGGEGLYEALRLWRLVEAKGQSIPPYVIFHNSVLREIAAMRPVQPR